MKELVFLFLLLLIHVSSQEGFCQLNGTFASCSNFCNEEDFVKTVKSTLKSKPYFKLEIRNSFFNFIPSDTFSKGYHISWLWILDSNLGGLTETTEAFRGLEDNLEQIRIQNTEILHLWEWSIFANLTKLSWMLMFHVNLASLEDMRDLRKCRIKRISFESCGISHIQSHAFAALKTLEWVHLQRNLLTQVQRTMFPKPANNLYRIDLSHNQLVILPPDIFSSMPALHDIRITGNRLMVLREETFKHIWLNLIRLQAEQIELHCDCRLSWILGQRIPWILRAVCQKPPELRGRDLMSLKDVDLRCI